MEKVVCSVCGIEWEFHPIINATEWTIRRKTNPPVSSYCPDAKPMTREEFSRTRSPQ